MATSWCATAGGLRDVTHHACISGHKRFFAICPLRPSLHKGTLYYRVPNPYIPVVLLRSVRGLGIRGQLIQTRRGMLRNFLLPQKLAVVASWQNIDKNHLLAQEASKVGIPKPTGKSVGFGENFVLSVPAGIFECVSSAATNVPARSGEGYVARISSSLTEHTTETHSAYEKHRGQRSGAVSSADARHTGPHTPLEAPGLQKQAEAPQEGGETETQISARSEGTKGLFGFLTGYCVRFVVDTDRSNPAMVRGKGVSAYDILTKLSEEVQVDLVPQQAKLTVTRAREDSSSKYPEEGAPLNPVQESFNGAGNLSKRIRGSLGSKRECNLEESDEEMGHDQVLRTCGLYEAQISLPLRHGAVVKREFSIRLVSKQEIARLLRAKRLRQKVEALRADFSLGPEL